MLFMLGIVLAILLMVLSVTVVNFIFAPMLRKAPSPKSLPKVSILIPARNEEQNIEHCLIGMRAQNYKNIEIIVLDDDSTDNTPTIVQNIVHEDTRVRYVKGKPLPTGWTGKTWACHQLSELATGEILIFTDADNQHDPEAISKTVGWMQKLELGLISAFPQQYTKSLAEKLIVPIMDIFVYGTLPLWLTYYSKYPSLAAANGQWIAFTKKAYQKIGGHRAVKNQIVEDTELNRLAKRKQIKTLTTAGTGMVYCRMYHSPKEVWDGFSKNFYGLTGYNNIAFFTVIVAMFLGFISPYFLWIFTSIKILALSAIGINILIRVIISIKYKHPLWTSAILHPIGIFFGIIIGINSFISIRKGKIRWKERIITVQLD